MEFIISFPIKQKSNCWRWKICVIQLSCADANTTAWCGIQFLALMSAKRDKFPHKNDKMVNTHQMFIYIFSIRHISASIEFHYIVSYARGCRYPYNIFVFSFVHIFFKLFVPNKFKWIEISWVFILYVDNVFCRIDFFKLLSFPLCGTFEIIKTHRRNSLRDKTNFIFDSINK